MNAGEVTLWGATVGFVAWDPKKGAAAFEYDRGFQDMGVELAPMMMPLSNEVYSFPTLNTDTYKGLPGMLADSLPDKFGNDVINQWLAENGRTPDSFNAVERLMYVGTRGMGALEFQPAIYENSSVELSLNIEELVALSSTILTLKEAQQFELTSGNAASNVAGLSKILAVGTSAGGARAKAIIAWNESTHHVRSGQIDAGDGYSYWLLKFDGVSNNKDKELADPKGYGRIEYAYHLMARDADIEMTQCRLMEEHGRAHFMTKRFDRTEDGQKLHMQSLCALGHHDFNSPGSTSYEQAFLMCNKLGLGMAAKEQLFLRMVFNVLAYNRDDHSKQISFLMDKSGQWQLSPAYDVTYSFNPNGEFTNSHQMTINRKRKDINNEDFLSVAKRQGLNTSAAKKLIENVRAATAQWHNYANIAGVDDRKRIMIGELISPT
ncbi:MAG: type II toxin-antitoxin system HipA family toxin [Oceanicoccus sp.]|uniref:type II toxin-antitoxin system HipA family toxin n=1 Tax=Oceanicoccus sp. TaxID=2691044 RepID=UPI00261CC9AF|nr:type II toxin-antitoxin system HipA family toxin [Oceanicoccus sp.]MCP3908824.1 type II toxin-antitoxin system HipA family toxin [Oceanicoccus sp.]MDG1771803.1 type II toxin-antitoxin system HipA family toxin [Oceanicoccus sp.]